MPICTPLYNKFVGKMFARGIQAFERPIRLRNIRIGHPAVANRLHIGEVVRYESHTFIHNVEGRQIGSLGATLRIFGAHHVGESFRAPGCSFKPPLPAHVRIVYIDTCKLSWCSVGSVAFQSSVWPRSTKEAKGIARTLFINRCNWADVLIVRGRCFRSHRGRFRANRVLENLLWNWSKVERPYVVYKEGNEGICGGDPVPGWLEDWCVYKELCLCNVVGKDKRGEARYPEYQGWHYVDAFYSNIVSRRRNFFENSCRCSGVNWPYPAGCDRNTMNNHIAVNLFRVVMHLLGDTFPSVPPRGVPSTFVLRSRNRKPMEEFSRYIN